MTTRREPTGKRPAVWSLDPEALVANRERVRRRAGPLQPALDALVAEADAALGRGPWSVMDKAALPPSGDGHDYVSYGPYWWPDPDRPDGLPYVRRDGETNPVASNPARSDSPALREMVEAVEALALAHHFTGREGYARRAAEVLRTWFLLPETRMNPHLEYGQAIPGRVQGRGVGIIDTSRLVRVVDAVGLLDAPGAWNADDREGLRGWFAAYLCWLLDSAHGADERRAANNHGTWYDAQVAAFALFVGRDDLARATVDESTTRRIAAQIEPDGRQPEELARTKAFDYSTMNLQGFFALATMGERVGVDLWRHRAEGSGGLRDALGFLLPYADPAVAWPYPQIVPTTRARLLPLILQARRAYGDDGRYTRAIAALPQEDVARHRAWLLWPA